MAKRESFSDILDRLRGDAATAECVADAVQRLSTSPYVPHVGEYLLKRFGNDPKLTRVMIRAAGRSRSRALHDILAQELMGPSSSVYAYELIDALSETGRSDYAATIVPFLESSGDEAVRTTAAHALGMLQSSVAIRPLVKQFQWSRNKRMKNLCVGSIKRILGGRTNSDSLELYLTDAPKKTREKLLEAIVNAA